MVGKLLKFQQLFYKLKVTWKYRSSGMLGSHVLQIIYRWDIQNKSEVEARHGIPSTQKAEARGL
jgi:hypothetical protein